MAAYTRYSTASSGKNSLTAGKRHDVIRDDLLHYWASLILRTVPKTKKMEKSWNKTELLRETVRVILRRGSPEGGSETTV